MRPARTIARALSSHLGPDTRVPCAAAVDAFIALGGNQDKTGQVSTDKLRHIVKEFGLTIDINRLIAETDTDKSGFIDYNEFAVMMK